MADVSEPFEWASGSMKDLAERMNDIDKQLDEIVDDGGRDRLNQSKDSDDSTDDDVHGEVYSSTSPQVISGGTNNTSFIDDSDDDEESERDYDLALDDLQSELNEISVAAAAAMAESPSKTSSERPEAAIDTIVTATIRKPTKESTVGISMKTVRGVTRITGIKSDGLLAATSLKPGYEILVINNVKVKNAKHARHLIQEASSGVVISTRMMPR
mmetsp:Transcript_29/g.84  ORF Transcript_29/g.84 Transcript_29/m.84 type:complete len:214 (+) Transcript_29:537-1178(+)|eukprot:CAMPEP_0119561028 /NCGR_PEP_ID=MMETSP1352-20130426/16459_1 /TAXON_ID=265584 /ORGANISM="Stauroneis constricta, Strain CCMP1120" /LENGTH=213 /DNA_ID=CAMNT_0007609129 /DNA_START=466 /DNA_END=1107 /DNA_ORIENTATION=+